MPRGISVTDQANLENRLYTPVLDNAALWFDCSNKSSFFIPSGVAELRDMSVYRRNFGQNNSANRPTFDEASQELRFDASNDVLTTSSSGATGISNTTFFFLAKIVLNESNDLVIGIGSTTNAARWVFRTGSNPTKMNFACVGNDVASALTYQPSSQKAFYNVKQEGTSVTFGNNLTESTSTLGSAPGNVGNAIAALGGRYDTTSYATNLALNEMVVFYSAVSDMVKNKVIGYILRKWAGWSSLLPANHLYKNNPPLR